MDPILKHECGVKTVVGVVAQPGFDHHSEDWKGRGENPQERMEFAQPPGEEEPGPKRRGANIERQAFPSHPEVGPPGREWTALAPLYLGSPNIRDLSLLKSLLDGGVKLQWRGLQIL